MGETGDYIESAIRNGECDESGEIFYDFDSMAEDFFSDEDEETED